jgi:hypothetical protein
MLLLPVFPGAAVAEASTAAVPQGLFVVIPVGRGDSVYDPSAVERYLSNPTVQGIALRQYWSDLEPNHQGNYQFGNIDDLLARAHAHGKTVQLILVPGYHSPNWLLNSLASCDPLLAGNPVPQTPPPAPSCGEATFSAFSGGILPLPWNATYVNA